MNIKRGLFRVWAVLTALFIVTVALLSFGDISQQFQGRWPGQPWDAIAFATAFAFGIPLLVLILGGGIFWTIAGFSAAAKRNSP